MRPVASDTSMMRLTRDRWFWFTGTPLALLSSYFVFFFFFYVLVPNSATDVL